MIFDKSAAVPDKLSKEQIDSRLENLETQARKDRFRISEMLQLVKIVRSMNAGGVETDSEEEEELPAVKFENHMHKIMDELDIILPVATEKQLDTIRRLTHEIGTLINRRFQEIQDEEEDIEQEDD